MEELRRHAEQARTKLFSNAASRLSRAANIVQRVVHRPGPARRCWAEPWSSTRRHGVWKAPSEFLAKTLQSKLKSSPLYPLVELGSREVLHDGKGIILEKDKGEWEFGKETGQETVLALAQPLGKKEGLWEGLLQKLSMELDKLSWQAQHILATGLLPLGNAGMMTGRGNGSVYSHGLAERQMTGGKELVLFRAAHSPRLRRPSSHHEEDIRHLQDPLRIQWHEQTVGAEEARDGRAKSSRGAGMISVEGEQSRRDLWKRSRMRRLGARRAGRRSPAESGMGRRGTPFFGNAGAYGEGQQHQQQHQRHPQQMRLRQPQILEALPMGLQRSLRRMVMHPTTTRQSQAPLRVSGRYESRTGVCEGCMAADAGPWLRVRAVAEGRWGGPASRVSLLHDFWIFRMRWDGMRGPPSIAANLHSGENFLVQYAYDQQERRGRRNAVVIGAECTAARYRGFVKLRLPSLRCDLLSLDFPNGELGYHRHKGWKAHVFVPVGWGTAQIQGRQPGSTRISYTLRSPWGTNVTPSVLLPDASACLDISQPVCWHRIGPTLQPSVTLRFSPVIGGRDPGWLAELTHKPHSSVALKGGFQSSAIEPMAFASCSIGKSKRAENENELGPRLQMSCKVPVTNVRRTTFTLEVNKSIDF